MDNCFAAKRFFPSCLFCFALLISQLTKLFLPFDWKDLISQFLSKSRFVFVLSICFFILNSSLYSIFNDHEPLLVLGSEFNMESNPDAHCASQVSLDDSTPSCRLSRHRETLHMASHPMHFSIFPNEAQAPPLKKWWRWWESNPWPPACRAGALPAELHPHIGRSVPENWTTNRGSLAEIQSHIPRFLFWSISKLRRSR